jgi:Zn-dependent protease
MCYADVTAAYIPDKNFPIHIELTSLFSDGFRQITVSYRLFDDIGKNPKTTRIDAFSGTLEEQLRAHQEGLAELKDKKELIALKPQEYVEAEKLSAGEYLDSLIHDGFLKAAEEGRYKMKLIPAISYMIKYVKNTNKRKAMLQMRNSSKPTESTAVDIPIEAEAGAFFRMRDIAAPKKMGYVGKIAVFAVSLLIFIAAFKISFSFYVILIMIGVLVIHESGHLIGMKLFRYKDVQVLFLPFIGAATVGSERNATALQRVVVYLMGPAPGIIIGTCCMLLNDATHNKLLGEFGIFLLVLNYLNMLPIVPLDGGRIFELVLFSRVHFLKSLFLILSVAVLGIAGVSMGDPILIIISVSLFFGIRYQIKQNKELSELKRKIKAENIELKDEIIVPTIFKMLKEKPAGNLPFEKKFQLVKYLLDNSTTELPSISTTLLSLLMYFIVWILPIFVMLTFITISIIWKLIQRG